MESPDIQEPSYYEVALTNRQVLIAFVALLVCLLVAFLSGVWIGRGGSDAAEVANAGRNASETAQQAKAEPPIEQLSFFNSTDPAKAEARPAAAETKPALPDAASADSPSSDSRTAPATPPAPAEVPTAEVADPSDAMRQNLEATMAANRDTPAMKLAVGERTGAPDSSGSRPAVEVPEKPATKPAPAPVRPETKPAAAPAGRMFVQVYSSNNGARAREIVADLRKAGFPVVMAESPKGSGKMFRVRVGPFAARPDADAAAVRLRRDHRLDTWVTDSP